MPDRPPLDVGSGLALVVNTSGRGERSPLEPNS